MNISILHRIRLLYEIYDPPTVVVQKVLREGLRWIFTIIQTIIDKKRTSIILLNPDTMTTQEDESIKKKD